MVVAKILVHKFNMGDVEDPELYAAGPILSFEKTDKGQWLHNHSVEQMAYDIVTDFDTYGYKCLIHAWLEEKDLTYYQLKWGQNV